MPAALPAHDTVGVQTEEVPESLSGEEDGVPMDTVTRQAGEAVEDLD